MKLLFIHIIMILSFFRPSRIRFENGTLKGIKTRNRATVTELKWADGGKTISATVTSDIDQKLNIKAGGKSQTVEFKAGESKTFRF